MTQRTPAEIAAEGMRTAELWSSFWSFDDAVSLCAAAISALDRAGFAVVPKRPTRSMIDAADDQSTDGMFTNSDTSIERIYESMLSAAPRQGGKT